MKIALVSPYDWDVPGGVNTHVAALSLQLRDRGHEVKILAPAARDVADPHVITIGRPWPVSASGSVVRIALDPRVGRRVKQVLTQEQFDVVHVHEPLMPVLAIHVLRHSRTANPRVVNVGTFHATKDGGNRLYSYGRRLLKRWFRELDGKITVSPPAGQYVEQYFHGYYNIIPNGLDVAHWSQPDVVPMPGFEGTTNILYTGRAEKRKGLAVLIRAFGMVNARNPETRLVIVGPDSRARRRYEAWVVRSSRRGIIFVPQQPYKDLLRFHRASTVFCSPALGNESQGYVLMEAMAAGTPVIASNIDGYASVITHGVDGLLVRPNDAMALADALTGLLNDPRQRATLAAAGRRKVEEYSWPRVAQQVLSYYERLRDQQETVEASRRLAVRHTLTVAP